MWLMEPLASSRLARTSQPLAMRSIVALETRAVLKARWIMGRITQHTMRRDHGISEARAKLKVSAVSTKASAKGVS